MRTSINKWNHLDQKSCWKNLSQQQQTSRLQCEKLRTHEQRRQRSNNTNFFSHLSSSYLLFCDNQQNEDNRSNNEWSRHYRTNSEFNIKSLRSSICRRTKNIWFVNTDKRFFLFHINVAWIRLTEKTNSIFIEMWLKRNVFLNTQLKKIFTWLFSLTLSQKHRIFNSVIIWLFKKNFIASSFMKDFHNFDFADGVTKTSNIDQYSTLIFINTTFQIIHILSSSTSDIDVFVLIKNKTDMNRVLNCRHD